MHAIFQLATLATVGLTFAVGLAELAAARVRWTETERPVKH
jgi:hypothetical protein